MSETTDATWPKPKQAPAVSDGCTEADIREWRVLTERAGVLALIRGWSKAEVARRADVGVGTFSQWYSGSYKGRFEAINRRIRQWLDSEEEAIQVARASARAPGFVMTRTAIEIEQTLAYAQQLPEMAVITLAAGMGKTAAARHYCATRPNAYHVTMSPVTKGVYGMLLEIAAALDLPYRANAGMHRLIGERLSRAPNTLLILDEAQNLSDQAVDQARSFLDLCACGLVLMGNEEIYSRFERKQDGPSYAQIRRRIGKRMRRMKPYKEDIDALIDAWEIADSGARKLLSGIGQKGGALGQIDKTLRLASILAAGDPAADGVITEDHVRASWVNRGLEV